MEGLYLVTIEALPVSSAHGAVGGAYINVFTTAATEREALDVATREISSAGWQVKNLDSVTWVTRTDYQEDAPGLEHFEQALLDGIVLVIYTYPPDSGELNQLH